jgi:Flp pilus assembly pilin Flp
MKRKGVAVIEYSFFIAIFIAAILSIMFYVKRGIMGQWRQNGNVFGQGRQYEPCVTTINGKRAPCN